MTRRLLACVAVLTVLAAACGAQDAEEAAEKKNDVTTTAVEGGGESGAKKFGTVDSPCGPGKATVAAAEAGKGTDKLYIGVGNDRSSTIRNGLNKEVWDSSVGFVAWCNEQGGIAGLQIEIVDLDAKLLEVEAAMANACTQTFAIVGGGITQDNFMFSGKDGSDFHKCKLIAFPGFAVSTDLNEANGQIQPLPNPSYKRPSAWLEDLAELYPDKIADFGVVFGDFPSIRQNKDQVVGVAKAIDGYGKFTEITYDVGTPNFALVAQQVKEAGLQMLSFVGEPGNFAKFNRALKDQGFDGVVFADSNQYDSIVIESGGPEGVEGAIARIASHPYEEGDRWPVTQEMKSIIEDNVPDAKIASLTNQSFSAWLLFAQSAKACAENGSGELTRDCVLGEAKKVTEWDGGGLHATANPAENLPSKCSMLVQVKDGKFTRLFPELDSDDDDGDGFSCGTEGIIELVGDFGQGQVDPTRKV
jgi:ABC-type branched-subunit amino acid transport system substrate-binding protein